MKNRLLQDPCSHLEPLWGELVSFAIQLILLGSMCLVSRLESNIPAQERLLFAAFRHMLHASLFLTLSTALVRRFRHFCCEIASFWPLYPGRTRRTKEHVATDPAIAAAANAGCDPASTCPRLADSPMPPDPAATPKPARVIPERPAAESAGRWTLCRGSRSVWR